MFLIVIIMYLFAMVYIQTRDNKFTAIDTVRGSKSLRLILEIGIIILSLAMPMTVLWFPFHMNLYGHSNFVCHMNSSDNLPKGVKIMRGVISYTPTELAGLVAIFTALGLTIQYRVLRRHQMARQLLKRLILSLLIVIFFSVADNVMMVIWYHVDVDGHHITMARLCISLLITLCQ